MIFASAPAFSLRSRIEEFEQFQEFCGTYQHGIRARRSAGSLYSDDSGTYTTRRATTFIYAFFVFNDIYRINWEASLKNPDDEPVEWSGLSQQEMFWKAAAFCFANRHKHIDSYTTTLVRYCRTFGVTNPTGQLKRIDDAQNHYLTAQLTRQCEAREQRGREISIRSIDDFRVSFGELYAHGTSQRAGVLDAGLTHINNVLYFVYLVRCSVFHGRKQLTVANLGHSQDVRLSIYAAIIMALNDAVLGRAKRQLRLPSAPSAGSTVPDA